MTVHLPVGNRPAITMILVLTVLITLGISARLGLAGTPGRAAASPAPAAVIPGHIADSTIVSCPATGAVVAGGYTGLSIEWSMVEHWFGTSRTTVQPAFVNLLNSLELTAGTPGVLRIGGNSQDGYQWSRDGSTAANSLFFGTINAGLVDALFEVARQTGWRVIFGLNLRNDNPQLAVELAKYVVGQDTTRQLLAFEIGNEPNAYQTESQYLARYQAYVAALRADPATATSPITGPAISENADVTWARDLWLSYQPTGLMPFVTWHDYANAATLAILLRTVKITEFTDRIAAMVAAVGAMNHAMGEGNDTGGGGLDNVSNVQGKSAWAIDTLLSGAARGMRGYQMHSWDGFPYPSDNRTSWYTPFVVRNSQTMPRPGFYALALFKFALGRRFCGVSTTNAANQLVRTWAVTDPATGRVYTYAINKGGAGRAGTASVSAPGGHTGTAFLNVMRDTGGCVGKTTSIQGATLPVDGRYAWTGVPIGPVPGTRRYEFTLPECATALVSVP